VTWRSNRISVARQPVLHLALEAVQSSGMDHRLKAASRLKGSLGGKPEESPYECLGASVPGT